MNVKFFFENQCYSLYEILGNCITAILISSKVVGGSEEARQNKNNEVERGQMRRTQVKGLPL